LIDVDDALARKLAQSKKLGQFSDCILQVQNLMIAPASPQSGDQVTITWDDANTGNGDSGAYRNLIQVYNSTTGVNHVYQAQDADAVLAGESNARSFTFTLPNGDAGVGNLTIRITNDWYNEVYEYNVAGTAETNNEETLDAVSTIATYPDLAVQDLEVTPSTDVTSSSTVQITWNDVNIGSESADASWSDRIVVVNTRTGVEKTTTSASANAIFGSVVAKSIVPNRSAAAMVSGR